MWSSLKHKCIQNKNEIQKTKINVQRGQWLKMTLIDSMTLNINFNCYLIYSYINFRCYIEKNNKGGYYLRLPHFVISKVANIQFLFLDQLLPSSSGSYCFLPGNRSSKLLVASKLLLFNFFLIIFSQYIDILMGGDGLMVVCCPGLGRATSENVLPSIGGKLKRNYSIYSIAASVFLLPTSCYRECIPLHT